MDDIFEGEVERASTEIQESSVNVNVDDMPSELQEQYNNIESLVSMNPDVVNSPEYKDLMAKIDSYQASEAEESEEEDEEEEESDEEEEESEESEEDDDEEDDIDDPFGLLGKGKKKSKKVKLDFDIPEEMTNLLGSRYGIEDPETFFGSVDTWRTQAQEGAETKKQLESLTSDIQNLPPDLRQSLSMWADGDDYKTPFTQGERLDFGSEFEKQDVESLVEHYLPEEYSRLINEFKSEKIDEAELDDKIDLLARSTKKLFTQEKKALVDGRVQFEANQADLIKKVKISALDSVEALSKTYPNFSKSELARVKSYLVDGKVDSIFYNADGTYTEKAAEAVANSLLGDKMRKTIEELAKRKGMSEANQRIVDSSPKTVKKNKSSNAKGKANVKAVQHLSSVVQNDDPYA